MTRSMTGFARQEQTFSWGNAIWELRSVNHRYLETSFRLPDTLRELEPKLRDAVRQALQRGKLEATLHLQLEQASEQTIGLNMERVRQLALAGQQITAQLDQAAPISPLEILRWPGVIQEAELDRETMQQAVLKLFDSSLQQLIEHRTREGAELEQHLLQRLSTISKHVAHLRQRMPDIIQAQREKLQSKIAALQVELDPERLEQEIALLAQKADVDEELDRLDTHVIEVKHTLKQSNSLGRRLDFLMQELNREANTLSSKAVVAETTQVAVELKVLIEQMREQIQNIE